MLLRRALLLLALLGLFQLSTAARPLKHAPLQQGAHFLVVAQRSESLRELSERFQVDLEELQDYNQQIKGTDADAKLKPGTTVHLPGCDHSHGWDEGWDGMGWENSERRAA
ncbi:hypothetical protein COHA_005723 [Chlorella ohadii]|uniref:LysM domain-containing protein n=1 Tax=Chlorella ohadii TaxID=2649997 RepID=A0AAD5DRA7_9CHLO|nr:hypothetical protein COHA_005723 [Chlorella ohadii]